MGQKDLTGKNFLLYQDVYADTLNALAFDGSAFADATDSDRRQKVSENIEFYDRGRQERSDNHV